MPKLTNQIKALSEDIEYKLEEGPDGRPVILDPPTVKLKLSYRNTVDILRASASEIPGLNICRIARGAVEDWDVTIDGKPVPLNDETRRLYLEALFDCYVSGRTDAGGEKVLLVRAIYEDCQDRSLFLKN